MHASASLMACISYPSLLTLSILLIIFTSQSSAKNSPPHALVSPVTKDAATGQYLLSLNLGTPSRAVKLSIDLAGTYLWVNCDNACNSSTYRPLTCPSKQCSQAFNSNCGMCFWNSVPHCDNTSCTTFLISPFTNYGAGGRLSEDVLSLKTTNGSTPGPLAIDRKFLFACADTKLFSTSENSIASAAVGVAGLGRDKDSLPSQLSSYFGLSRKFATCLSSSTGAVFFGEGPYNILPNVDASKWLIYTPLLVNPIQVGQDYDKKMRTAAYYLGLTAIRINGKTLLNSSRMFQINKGGYGGVMFSSFGKYTSLYTPIYKVLLKEFRDAMPGIPTVPPVDPFGLCFNSTFIHSTRLGPTVPIIDLVFQNDNVYWRIYGANSMVLANEHALCLGFVDAYNAPPASILLGGYQLEHNLLQFDLEKSMLGFSSSLLTRRTSCYDFNFMT